MNSGATDGLPHMPQGHLDARFSQAGVPLPWETVDAALNSSELYDWDFDCDEEVFHPGGNRAYV
jgi:hypothetical protein